MLGVGAGRRGPARYSRPLPPAQNCYTLVSPVTSCYNSHVPRTLLPPRPFIPAPNCASVEIFYSANAVVCENVFHVNKASPYDNAALVALRNVVDTWDNTTWKGSRGNGASVFRIRCKALDTNSSPMDDYYLPTPRAGTIASPLTSGNSTLAFKLATNRAGRSYRGRWYLVGVTLANYGATANQYNVASANAIVSWLNLLKTNLAAAGHTLGVLSYATNKAWRTTAHFEPATGYLIIDYNIDSQRRRLTGRGI